MTKQLVNLIGAATTLAILVLAVLVFALPLFTQATRTAGEADAVAAQNRSQQGVLDALVAQSADMTALEAQVATSARRSPPRRASTTCSCLRSTRPPRRAARSPR